MNVNTLKEFRHAVYASFKRAEDALFNTVDALSSETAAHSFPQLSQSPFFERKWPSLYEALEDGQIDAQQLRQVFLQFAPLPGSGESVFVGVDTSNLYRKEAENAVIPGRMGNQMLRGKALMPRAGALKCVVGTTCTCARHARAR